ncbi:MAG: hypothetical protein ABII20_02260 [Candidatus Omnitrophota bacterium]|nr:hypothetical protein [Candidatus Omnitrophota bacterium]MBU3929841.1 hypothetical protein [bacterium]MBU4122738.1 hypothetical protein [bacterium]
MMQRTQFFAKPKIQIKYVLVTVFMVLMAAVISVLVMDYRITHSTFAENLSLGEVQALVHETRMSVLYISGIFLVMVFIKLTLFFHHLIGPLVVIERTLDIMKEGYFGGKIRLRNNDELKDLAESIEALGEIILRESSGARSKIDEVSKKLDEMKDRIGGKDYTEMKQKLDGSMAFFKDHFGSEAAAKLMKK